MSTDPAARAAFIAGLRELADFLESHPAVAVPSYGTDITVQPCGTDEEEAADIDAFAAAAGVEVLDWRRTGDARGYHVGRYSAVRKFGPVTLTAFTYTAKTLAEHDARRSYDRNIQPDDATPVELDEAA
jgi:hypothetical protein